MTQVLEAPVRTSYNLVWTGTWTDGTRQQTCGDWTSSSGTETAIVGGSSDTTGGWLVATETECAWPSAGLYCVSTTP